MLAVSAMQVEIIYAIHSGSAIGIRITKLIRNGTRVSLCFDRSMPITVRANSPVRMITFIIRIPE